MKKIVCIILAMMFALVCAATAEGSNVSLTTGQANGAQNHIMVVQLDNEPGARPQKGIASADIVYEVELYNGGYTRYTAVFNDVIPAEVEAVRSARIVNTDIYSEYMGAFVHYGARVEPDSNMYDYFNANGFTAELDGNNHNPRKAYPGATEKFYRDRSRKSPNNVVGKLGELHDMVDWSALTCRSPLKFNGFATIPLLGQDVSSFRIAYKDGYTASYNWDAVAGKYLRYYNDAPFVDGATGEQIACDNVIVQSVEYSWFNGNSEAPNVTMYGTNRCEYFIGGRHFSGYWVRDNITANTVYYDDAGTEVVFNPGKTYIEILKTEKAVEILG